MSNYPQLEEHLGKRLRKLRLDKGLSQNDLANEADITFQQIQKYEKGVNRMAASTLKHFSDILSVSILDFFDGVGDEPKKEPKTLIPIQFICVKDMPANQAAFLPQKVLQECIKKGMDISQPISFDFGEANGRTVVTATQTIRAQVRTNEKK